MIVGNGFTVTVTVWVFTQPLPSVPVTVYVVVDPGLAVVVSKVVFVKPALLVHTYVVAPPAVSWVWLPAHIAGVGGTTVITGNGFTVIVTIPLSTQPCAVVPTTV